MTPAEEKLLTDRIEWLKQKLQSQRAPSSRDYTSNPLFIGRTEGNIGALEWAVRELRKVDSAEVDPEALDVLQRKAGLKR
jgi:hypothetical protein